MRGRCSPRRLAARLVLVAALSALAAPAPAAHPAHRVYTTRDGLPQSQVTAVVQDRAGWLWVGTLTGGVARYDGHRWDVFDTAQGLPGSGVNVLVVDQKGTVWAGTSGGAARFDGTAFVPLPPPPDPRQRPVSALAATGGALWIGTSHGLLLWDGRALTSPFTGHALATASVNALSAGVRGETWVASRVAGLQRVAVAPARVLDAPAPPGTGPVLAVLQREGHPLIVSVADLGAFALAGESWTRLGDDQQPGRRVLGMFATDDALFLLNDRMAFRLGDGAATVTEFGRAQGIPGAVNAVFEDREGVLWFATDRGLVKRGASAFVTLDAADHFPEDVTIFGMAEDAADGSLWFGAWDEGVLHQAKDGTMRRFGAADGLVGRVHDLLADRQGGVWIALRRGLVRLRGDRVETVAVAGLPRNPFALAFTPDHTLLVAGADGVAAVKGATAEMIPALRGHDTTALLVARDGTVWAGGNGWGAIGAHPDGRVETPADLPSAQVGALFEDSRGALWISTERGAWQRTADGRVSVVDRSRGLPGSYVYWVGEDRAHALWFGTNRGAARRGDDGTFTVYTHRDGLGDDECNDDGFFVDSRGTLYVSTVGVARFEGVPRARHPVEPPVVLRALEVDGVPQKLEDVVLPPQPGPIRIAFAALAYADEAGLRFRYRLLGLSPAWTEAGPGQRETTYGGLGPGVYTFEVVAYTADGRASAQPARLVLTIRPPWWQTAPALVGLALWLLLGAAAYVRWREHRLEARRARLARLVDERTEELRLANDRLGQLAVTDELTGIANRRRAVERLNETIALARRQGTALAIALCDLDKFKAVNDTRGHPEGDQLLRLSAAAMGSVLRSVDLLGRYGGEEFLVVLPGTDLAGAREVGEKLRRAVTALPFTHPATGRGPTVSVGVAALTGDESIEQLVHRADDALYRAKKSGRDRVCADPP